MQRRNQMKYVLFVAMVTIASVSGQSILNSELAETKPQHATSSLEVDNHFFIVEFTYQMNYASVPITYPPGATHYGAQIVVFEIVNGKKEPIGKPFPGEYTGGLCFEDDPVALVENTLKANGRLTASILAALSKIKEARAFEAQPLYSENDGIITVTPRGERDLKAVVV